MNIRQHLAFLLRRAGVGAAFACATLGVTASAQPAYPGAGPIKVVQPFPAGGGGDVVARVLAAELQEAIGQVVMVENRVGAGGMLGSAHVASSSSDGYTILSAGSWLLQSSHLRHENPFKATADLVPLMQIGQSRAVFVVRDDLPVKSLKEFYELAKANPGKYSYGTYGNGTIGHIYGEYLNNQEGTQVAHIPYQGAARVLADLLGEHIPAGFVDIGSAVPHLSGGKLRVLAVTGAERSVIMPDVPTFVESGYSSLGANGWMAWFVPTGTPPDVVQKLSGHLTQIVGRPEVAERLQKIGVDPHAKGHDEFAPEFIRDDEVWREVVAESGIPKT